MRRTMTTSAHRSTAVPAGRSSFASGAPATWAAAGGASNPDSLVLQRLTSPAASISLSPILRAIKFGPPLLLLLLACSPKRYALNHIADSLSATGEDSAFSRDDDPELVRDALPFALKTMESLAMSLDDHVGLRLGMASGFTGYAFAFLQQPAELGAPPDQARVMLARARK